MTEKSKKLKKGVITEEDISALLQRYSANTVLTLLQEVAQFEGVKMDWNALVKKSTTGIANAREYQMLWRHLAYRHSLLERFEDGAQPLDDGSDLEYELEAFPAVSSEALAEASACVKVLIASGLTSDSVHPNNVMVEAPLTINIPNGQLAKATSESSHLHTMRGFNITVPVSVQKQPLPVMASAEALDINGLVNGTIPPRRKRKPWTKAEDLELVAAVQKYGEGNWANILRSEFSWDRTASQLSQRWAIIRKRVGNLNLATTSSSSGVQISEAQRAAQIALNLALETPVKNSFINSGEGTASQHRSQRAFGTKPSSIMQLGGAAKSQITVNKPAKPDLSLDPVRATAVAAGARIGSQSDAASLLIAAQAKNAVRRMPTVGSSVKSSLTSGASGNKEVHSNVNVDGLPTPVPTRPAVSPSGLCPALERASSQTCQRNPISGAAMNASNTELPPKQDVVNAGGIKSLPIAAKALIQEKAVLLNQETKIKTKESSGKSLNVPLKLEVAVAVTEGSQNGEQISLCVEKSENQRRGPSQANGENKGEPPRLVADQCGEELEDVDKKEPESTMKGGDN